MTACSLKTMSMRDLIHILRSSSERAAEESSPLFPPRSIRLQRQEKGSGGVDAYHSASFALRLSLPGVLMCCVSKPKAVTDPLRADPIATTHKQRQQERKGGRCSLFALYTQHPRNQASIRHGQAEGPQGAGGGVGLPAGQEGRPVRALFVAACLTFVAEVGTCRRPIRVQHAKSDEPTTYAYYSGSTFGNKGAWAAAVGAVDASEAAKVEKERDWRHKYTKCVDPSIALAWLFGRG